MKTRFAGLCQLLALTLVACFCLSALAVAADNATEANVRPRYVVIPQKPASPGQPAGTLATWNGTFNYNGTNYPYVMVGTDPAGAGFENRADVRRIRGARVDDGQLPFSDQIGIGARAGHDSGIRSDDAGDMAIEFPRDSRQQIVAGRAAILPAYPAKLRVRGIAVPEHLGTGGPARADAPVRGRVCSFSHGGACLSNNRRKLPTWGGRSRRIIAQTGSWVGQSWAPFEREV